LSVGTAIAFTKAATAGTAVAATDAATSTRRPSVSSLSPTHGTTAGGTAVVIYGAHLGGATAVHFGTAKAKITKIHSTAVHVKTPRHAKGTVEVTVTTPNGTSKKTTHSRFTYVHHYAPTVTHISPASGPAAGGTTVTVTGAHLSNVTSVHFGTRKGTSLHIVSSTKLTVHSPVGSGAVHVSATNKYGTSHKTTADIFTYNAPPPTPTPTPPTPTPTPPTPTPTPTPSCGSCSVCSGLCATCAGCTGCGSCATCGSCGGFCSSGGCSAAGGPGGRARGPAGTGQLLLRRVSPLRSRRPT
jgi:IPT/TIG domain-containing protein